MADPGWDPAIPDTGWAAWAAVNAGWRGGFRDAALLLCGVLISLAVELWLRAVFRD
jgi:hypothetical protein